MRSSSVTLVLWEASQTRLDAYRKGVTRNVPLLLFVCYVHCLLACYKVLVLLPVEKGVLLKEIVYLQIVFSWIFPYLSVFSQ